MRMLRDAYNAWFGLTPDESRAVVVVLALFLLGLIARFVIYRAEKPDPLPPPPAAGQTLAE